MDEWSTGQSFRITIVSEGQQFQLSTETEITPFLRGARRLQHPAPVAYTLEMERLWTPWRYAYVTGKDKGTPKNGVPAALAAWPGETHCVFCNILAAVEYGVAHGMPQDEADAAVYILERGRTCFLVLNAFPYNSGHLTVLPYQHEASLAALPDETAAELMTLTRQAERLLRKMYRPDGLNLGLNLGESAGAGVAEHLHLHAVPRWSGDNNFMSVLGETRILPEMLTESYRRLREALATEPAE
jgi:ATP adenylyltransferase